MIDSVDTYDLSQEKQEWNRPTLIFRCNVKLWDLHNSNALVNFLQSFLFHAPRKIRTEKYIKYIYSCLNISEAVDGCKPPRTRRFPFGKRLHVGPTRLFPATAGSPLLGGTSLQSVTWLKTYIRYVPKISQNSVYIKSDIHRTHHEIMIMIMIWSRSTRLSEMVWPRFIFMSTGTHWRHIAILGDERSSHCNLKIVLPASKILDIMIMNDLTTMIKNME